MAVLSVIRVFVLLNSILQKNAAFFVGLDKLHFS